MAPPDFERIPKISTPMVLITTNLLINHKLIGRATRASQLALGPTALACLQTLNSMLINSPHFLVHLLQIQLIARKIFLPSIFPWDKNMCFS